MAQKDIVYNNNTFHISYEVLNQNESKTILFLHGWGSNKEVMQTAFKNQLKEFRHIYVDMPGFGKSSNEIELTTSDYAKIMEIFLSQFNILNSEITILGHSFGGKVATLLNPKNLVLLSSAGIVEEKRFGVKFKIALAKVLKSFGLGGFTKIIRSKDVEKMSEAMYSTFKNVVNEEFSNSFKQFNNNALIFWGESDTATSLDSGKKIASLIQNSRFKSYSGNHYFFLENSDDISKRIKDGIL